MPYSPKVVIAPRLAGAGLRAFATLMEQPVSGLVVRDTLLRQLGLDSFRQVDVSHASTDPGPLPADARALPDKDQPDAWQVLQDNPTPCRGQAPPSIAGIRRAFLDGVVDPVHLTERFLRQWQSSEADKPRMSLFIHLNEADILNQANASKARYAAGESLGPLDGVLVAVKDELDQVPYPTTAGTSIHLTPAQSDSTAVARLRASGAILVGKLNMHELGSGITGINPHYGTPRNPFDPTRVCGGSSSGSGAIVACQMVPLSIACDAGGSIRMPAALTGNVGLKATKGRISNAGAADLVWTTAHVGPIGATIDEVAAAYLTIAGPDPRDPNTLHQPPVHLKDWARQDMKGLTLGVYRDWFEAADPEIVAMCQAQLRRFEVLGAEVREITLPDLDELQMAHLVLIAVEAAASQNGYYDSDPRKYGHESRMTISLARGLRATDYVHALRVRHRMIGRWLNATAGLDAVITPATGMVAPPLHADAVDLGESDMALAASMMRFMPPGNLLGFPAISFPIGYNENGLPVAMQALGRPWMEHALLRIARVAGAEVPRRTPKRLYRVGPN